MEASVAGQGQGDGAQQGQQGQGDGGFDPAQLASSLEALQGSQEEMRQFLMSQPWQQEQAGEGEQEQEAEPELDLSFLDVESPGFDPEQVADRLGGLIGQVADQRTQAAIAPMQEALAEMRRENEARDLAGEFEELADPAVAQNLIRVSDEVAQAYGHGELGKEPWFQRIIFMAARAAEARQTEQGGETPSAAHLEGGGGAAPSGQEVDLGAQILEPGGRKGRAALPFR